MTKKRAAVYKWFVVVLAMLMILVILPVFWVGATSASKIDVEIISAIVYEGKIDSGTTDPKLAGAVSKGSVYTLAAEIQDNRTITGSPSNIAAKIMASSFYGIGTKWDAFASYSSTNKYTLYIPFMFNGGQSKSFQLDICYTDANGDNVTQRVAAKPVPKIQQAESDPVEPSSSIPPSEPEPSSSSEVIVKGTGFVLKSVNYGASSIKAGDNFNLDAVMLSTNGTYNVENVSIEISPSKEFSIAAGSSILYVGTVKPNQNIPVVVPLIASAIVEEGSYQVTLKVSGVNSNDGTAVSAEMIITVPIVQPERFEMANITVPSFLTANMDDGSGFSSINLVNKGKGTIFNVSVKITGDGLTTDMGEQFIGNIATGTQSGADFNVLASVPGNISAQIVVSYENSSGEQKELTHDFTIEVQDMGDMNGGIDPYPMPEPEPEPTGLPFWAWLLIGVGGVAAIIVIIALVVRRKRKKAAAELEVDDDEDI